MSATVTGLLPEHFGTISQKNGSGGLAKKNYDGQNATLGVRALKKFILLKGASIRAA